MIPYELYNPNLSLAENCEVLGCSVSSLKKYLHRKEVDRAFDEKFKRWKVVNDYFSKNPSASLRKASEDLNLSVNTIRKYRSLAEDEIVSKRDKEKMSYFDIRNRNVIKSISYSQDEILSWILKLYNHGKTFDCDLTASKCVFWKSIPRPLNLFDKYPQLEEVRDLSEADKLPDCSFNAIIYDLPFIVSNPNTPNNIKDRFTYFTSVDEAYSVNLEMLHRAYRLLSKGGLLVVKTMDCLSQNGQLWISDYVVQKSQGIGLAMIDKFILLSHYKLLSKTRQQHIARKYHSYFLVFRKV